MDNFDEDEYNVYMEILRKEGLDSLNCWDDSGSMYYDSSSPDGAASSSTAKNIVSERNRRKKLNERLFALRAVVPNISKMDKASIVKDSIDYIQELHEQEKKIQEEIEVLESGNQLQTPNSDVGPSLSRKKKKRLDLISSDHSNNIEVLELRVSEVGERISLVSVTCRKKTDTMVKLCEVFETLKLKIVAANITAFSGRLLKTVFVEVDETEKARLKEKIQAAIDSHNGPPTFMTYHPFN